MAEELVNPTEPQPLTAPPTGDDDLGFVPNDNKDDIGFEPAEEDFGFEPAEVDTKTMRALVSANMEKAKPKEGEEPKVAEDWIDAIEAGWDMSVTGLISQGKPNMVLNEDSGRVAKVASTLGQIAGDFPAMVAGGVFGGVAGTFVGGPGLGTAVGAEFAANALPAAIRKTMMDHYEKGDIQNFSEFWDRFTGATWETFKGGAVGVATLGAGRYVGGAASKVAGKVVSGAAKTSAEIATMVSVGSALEGKVPDAEDFLNAGIVVGGLNGAMKVAPKIRGLFAGSGEMPMDVVEKANTDISYKQDLVSENKMMEPKKADIDLRVEKEAGDIKPITKLEYLQKANDDAADVKFIQDRLLSGKELLPDDKDAYIALRSRRAAETTAKFFEENGTVDFKTKEKTGEPLRAIMDEVPNKKGHEFTPEEKSILDRVEKSDHRSWFEENVLRFDKDEYGPTEGKFVAYSLAERAIELNERGIKVGVDIEAAKKVVASGKKEYGDLNKRFNDFQHRVLKFASDSGLFNKEQQDAILDLNKKYIPMQRLLEPDPFKAKRGEGGSTPKRIKGNEVLKFKDPLVQTRQNVLAIIKAAEDNNTKRLLVDVQERASANPEAPVLIKKVKSEQRPVNIEKEEVTKFLQSHGVETSEAVTEAMTVFRPKQKSLAENEFSIMRNGKREVYAIHEDFADAAKALNYNPEQLNLLQKILTVPAKTLRLGVTTLDMGFQLRNAFKDQFTAAVQSDTGMVPFVDMFEGFKHTFGRNTPEWEKFMLSKGISMGVDDLKMSPLSLSEIFKGDQDYGIIQNMWNKANSGMEILEYISSSIENTPRFIEAKRSGGLKAGASPEELARSGFRARNLTVDFDKAGALLRWLGKYDPFLNATLQGSEIGVKKLWQNKQKVAAIAGATITIPSVSLWMMNRDDSRYKSASLWERNTSWIIPTDNWQKAYNQDDYEARPDDLRRVGPDGALWVNNGITFKLPKPYFLGQVFGSFFERTLDAFYNEDKEAFKDFDQTLIASLLPDNEGALLPAAIKPVIEQRTNHIFFTDKPLVNNYMEGYLSDERYTPYTSEVAKQVGKIIGNVPGYKAEKKGVNLSDPVNVDNYIYSWSGTTGKYVVQLLDAGLHAAGVGDTTQRAAWAWEDVPIIKAFISRTAKVSPEDVKTFMERSSDAEMIRNSLRKAIKDRNKTRVDEILAEHGDSMEKLTSISQGVSAANKALNSINSDKDLDPVQKRQLMDTTYWQILKMAKEGNRIYDKIEAEAKKKDVKNVN